MGRVNTPVLTPDEETELERGFKEDKRHCFRMRCKLILLKAKGMKSNDVGEIIGMNYVSVNAWVKRFKAEWSCYIYMDSELRYNKLNNLYLRKWKKKDENLAESLN